MAQRTQYGNWEKLESLGKGGQGEVFRARRTVADSQVSQDILQAVDSIASVNSAAASRLVSLIRTISNEERTPLGALKILHEGVDVATVEKAAARMSAELEAMKQFEHPSLIRIRDANVRERWFVMEYFSHGTLLDHLTRTQDDVLGSLLAFRPLVHAVSQLHQNGYVHRDIKPGNIFIAGDGHLVLGDFGLVINAGAGEPRVTDTYENVGSRD
jgi:serine/threonine protein kinase